MVEVGSIIRRAIDLHVHIKPDALPRKYTALELAEKMMGKIRRICVKSHTFETVSIAQKVNKNLKTDFLIGSATLNNSVGGLNQSLLKALSKTCCDPIIVWLPTINAENYLKKSEWEIRPEWVKNSEFKPRKSGEVKAVKIDEELDKVLEIIKENNWALATGHISWQEAERVAVKALDMGVKVVITHPIYQLIDMPIETQISLAKEGALIEQCYSMNSIDKISIEKIAGQIKRVGAENCIISSDVGQTFSPDPDEALEKFANLLIKQGIKEKELERMMVKNPENLIT